MRQIVAIDPGANGGFAWMDPTGQVQAQRMPDTEGDILALVRRVAGRGSVAVLEEVGGYVGKFDPGNAMFKFGAGWGFLKGALMANDTPLHMVRPQKWQAGLSLGTSRSCGSKQEWKNKLKAHAQRLFPGLGVTLYTADALLILAWATQLRMHE